MNDDLRKYVHEKHMFQWQNTVYMAIEYEFPGIKGLEVIKKDDTSYTIIFEDTGVCTSEQVENYLAELTALAKETRIYLDENKGVDKLV